VLALATPALGEPLQPIPALRARVTDLTGTLSAGEQAELEQKLAAFEARKGAQVAVLIVATTQPEAIEPYAIRVVEAWRLGRSASDDGALLLVAKDDRALRIEVGYGLEGALTDAKSNRIIDQTIVPRFRAGDFAGGIEAGVDAMLAVIEGEELPPPEPGWAPDAISGLEQLLPLGLFAIAFGGPLLRRLFGGLLGPLLAGGLVSALVWLATRALLIALGFGLFAALFAAMAGRGPRGPFRRGGYPGWAGGIGGRGGFGGGGFSGGGGGFGGGGASGRW
jgi:uncharacterized protein